MNRNPNTSRMAFNEMAATDEKFVQANMGKFVTYSNGEFLSAANDAHEAVLAADTILLEKGADEGIDFGIVLSEESLAEARDAYNFGIDPA